MPEGVPIYGKALAELRWLRYMTQDDLSNACEINGWGVPRAMISAYERGKKRPTPQTLAAIAKALSLSRIEMRALVRTPTLDATTSKDSPTEEDHADRRAATKTLALGVLAAALTESDALERITTHGDRPTDVKLIASHEDLAGDLAQRYLTGPQSILPFVTLHADIVLGLLDRPIGVSDRSRLESLAVTVSTRAGHRAFHGGDRLAARKYLGAARTVADDSGNHTLTARALGMLSILSSSPRSWGQGVPSPKAVVWLDQAAALAAKADGFTRGWVSIWRAEEAIRARDAPRCRQSLDVADRALGDSPVDEHAFGPVGPLIYGVPGYLQVARGLASALDGEFDAAERQLAEAFGLKESARQHVIMLTQFASVRIDADNPEGACQALAEALDLARAEDYAMGIERILGVRARFPDPWNGLTCVAALDERLRGR